MTKKGLKVETITISLTKELVIKIGKAWNDHPMKDLFTNRSQFLKYVIGKGLMAISKEIEEGKM